MKPSSRIHSFASRELTEAVRWYESKRAGLGAELLDEFSASIARLTRNPESGNPMSADQKTWRLLITRFPYQVVYRVRPVEGTWLEESGDRVVRPVVAARVARGR